MGGGEGHGLVPCSSLCSQPETERKLQLIRMTEGFAATYLRIAALLSQQSLAWPNKCKPKINRQTWSIPSSQTPEQRVRELDRHLGPDTQISAIVLFVWTPPSGSPNSLFLSLSSLPPSLICFPALLIASNQRLQVGVFFSILLAPDPCDPKSVSLQTQGFFEG